MKNKNKRKLGPITVTRRCDGTISVEYDEHAMSNVMHHQMIMDLQNFLSTPYQEEEVYVCLGQRVKKVFDICMNDVYLVASIGDNYVVLIDVNTGYRYSDQKKVENIDHIKLRDIIGRSDISEWEVIK